MPLNDWLWLSHPGIYLNPYLTHLNFQPVQSFGSIEFHLYFESSQLFSSNYIPLNAVFGTCGVQIHLQKRLQSYSFCYIKKKKTVCMCDCLSVYWLYYFVMWIKINIIFYLKFFINPPCCSYSNKIGKMFFSQAIKMQNYLSLRFPHVPSALVHEHEHNTASYHIIILFLFLF